MKNKFTPKNVVLLGTLYALLLYLLYCKDEQIKSTFFVFDPRIKPIISDRFEHYYRQGDFNHLTNHWQTSWFVYKMIKWFKIPHISKEVTLYAQDHLPFSSTFIGNSDYTFIEDCAHQYDLWKYRAEKFEKERKEFKHRISAFLTGPTYYRIIGNNPQCRSIVVTNQETDERAKGKKQVIVDLKKEWENASEWKRQFILYIFNIFPNDLLLLKKAKFVLLTQPLNKDGISFAEHKRIYGKIIEQYPKDSLLIKVHPRDDFPYENEYPNIPIIRKQVPFELFTLIISSGFQILTVFSAAAFSGADNKILWYGTEISDELLEIYGNVPMPDGAIKCYI